MSKVIGTRVREGDVPSATDLNQVYTSVAGMTVDDVNTKDNWATERHFDKNNVSYVPMNVTYGASETGTWNTSSTTFVDVFGYTLVVNEPIEAEDRLIRVSWNTLIGASTLVSDATRADNLYAFRIKITFSNGSTVYIAPGVYSFSGRAYPTASPGLTPGPINWRSCAGSDTFCITSGAGINNIYLQAKVGTNTNTLQVKKMNLSVVLGRK